ncbi:BnaA01g25370D [Brassica napus]|uniref:(rape) hypothetical protein n=1 Tax=Brassica napus TaxID=3708 RepID=A0A078HHF9_BRANA|nr:unnamed protein product [Brassica napus]CDY37317.1 BnaA01g25370D [Brassica napus]
MLLLFLHSLDWDTGKTHHYYQCHVASDGSYTFKGPLLLEPAGTYLQKVLGDDNALTVYLRISRKIRQLVVLTLTLDTKRLPKMVSRLGYAVIKFLFSKMVEKKKDFSTKGMKCYFIRTDSTSAIDTGSPYMFSGKSIYEARMHFMHVHTLPSLANYMARYFSFFSVYLITFLF